MTHETISLNDVEKSVTLEELQYIREEINITERIETLKANAIASVGTSAAGSDIVYEYVERVVLHIDDAKENALSGKAGQFPKKLAQMLSDIPSNIAAALTLKCMVDTLSRKDDTKPITMVNVLSQVGYSVFEEHMRTKLSKANQKRYERFKRDNPHIKNKQEIIKRLSRINKYTNYSELDIEAGDAMKVGMTLVKSVIAADIGFKFSNPAIAIKTIQKNKKSPAYELVLVDDEIKQKVINTIANMLSKVSPAQAMIVPPKSWTGMTDGGYLSRQKTLIRMQGRVRESYSKGAEDNISDTVLSAVNYMQSIPFKISKGVFEVVKYAYENEDDFNGALPQFKKDKPKPLPVDPEFRKEFIAESEANKLEYSKVIQSRKFTHRKNNAVIPGQQRMSRNIYDTAEGYIEYEKLYFPGSLDWRGRYYPLATEGGLTPQGGDLAKGLLTFARKKPLGEEGIFWMKIQLAGTFENGIEKLSFTDRVNWVDENEFTILASARDPINFRWWTKAESPWQFLQAIIEYSNAHASGNMETYESSLKVALDGTCNGLQHYGAMGRSGFEAVNTNLVMADKPADLYTAVLDYVVGRLKEKSIELQEDDQTKALYELYKAGKTKDKREYDQTLYVKVLELHAINLLLTDPDLLSRSIVKQPVMTTPYSVSQAGMKEQIEKKLTEAKNAEKVPLPLVYGEDIIALIARTLSYHIAESMKELAKGASTSQQFFKELAREAAKAGQVMRWTTPDGFTVANAYYERAEGVIRSKLMGDFKIKQRKFINTETGEEVSLTDLQHKAEEAVDIRMRYKVLKNPESPIIDVKKTTNAVAPNIVHSLDATHLRMIANEFNERGLDLVTVHDSFGTHACDAGALSQVTRETFHALYQDDMLAYIKQSAIDNSDSAAAKSALASVEVPEIGFFDIDEVLEAQYLFS